MSQEEYPRNREDSSLSKIVVDRVKCIGAAPCVSIAPDTFAIDDDNKAVVIDPNVANDDMIRLAAESCPVHAILLYDKENNQVYPK